jgi:hypothetical protein
VEIAAGDVAGGVRIIGDGDALWIGGVSWPDAWRVAVRSRLEIEPSNDTGIDGCGAGEPVVIFADIVSFFWGRFDDRTR